MKNKTKQSRGEGGKIANIYIRINLILFFILEISGFPYFICALCGSDRDDVDLNF